MTRFFADQCVSEVAIATLVSAGIDVESATATIPGAPDTRVLAEARRSGRVLVTLDKDFGELVFRDRKLAPPGVILFRLEGSSPAEDNHRIVSVLESTMDWRGFFSVVTSRSIRMRPISPRRTRPR